jgi:hypothetical protein
LQPQPAGREGGLQPRGACAAASGTVVQHGSERCAGEGLRRLCSSGQHFFYFLFFYL